MSWTPGVASSPSVERPAWTRVASGRNGTSLAASRCVPMGNLATCLMGMAVYIASVERLWVALQQHGRIGIFHETSCCAPMAFPDMCWMAGGAYTGSVRPLAFLLD